MSRTDSKSDRLPYCSDGDPIRELPPLGTCTYGATGQSNKCGKVFGRPKIIYASCVDAQGEEEESRELCQTS